MATHGNVSHVAGRARSSLTRTLALLAAAPLLAAPVLEGAPARYIRFTNLSLEAGLSQGAVNCIFQDHRGFLWFGTQDGLNRYDGYSFTVFKSDPQNPSSLSGNTIWTIFEDKAGILWIGTDGGGLARLDLRTNAFSALRNDPANPSSLSSNRVRAIAETPDGVLWVGTDGGGLNKLDRATGRITRFLQDPTKPGSLSSDRIRALLVDRAGALWIGSDGGGLSRLDPGSGAFTHYRHDDAAAGSLGEDRVRCLLEARDGALWIGTYSRGLDRMDAKSGTFAHFRNDPRDPASLVHDRVWSLLEDRDGTLWVGTNGGLNERRAGETGFARYVHQPTDPASLADSRILSLYQDRGGVLWAGSQAGGLDKWNPWSAAFALYRVDPSAGTSLSSDTINSFADGPGGTLYVGTWSGLNVLDRAKGTVRVHRHDPKNPASLSDDRVMSLCRDRDGTLWIGTLEGGLNRFDESRGTFGRFRHDPADPASLGGNGVTSVFQDGKGNLWVGVFNGGLNRLVPATKTFVRYRHDPANPASLSDDKVLVIAEDSTGGLWVGTESGGLNRFDRESGGFASTKNDPTRADSLGPGVIFCIHEDRHGTLWIGTQGGGLSGWSVTDRKANRPVFRRVGERDGLSNDTVYGILEDQKGTLWLSTNRGLSNFDPVGNTIRNFDQSYGLQSNEFNFGAYLRSASGEMLFGGNGGFNAFFPDRVRRNENVPAVLLTGFLKLTRRTRFETDVSEVPEIRLGYKDYVVSFEYAALDFAAPAKNRYSYRLEGFDRDWIDAGETRRATYTNLPSGTFVFRVRGSNNDGVWNETGASVRVVVTPPPWKSWWAWTLYALAALGAIAWYVRRARRLLEREAERGRILEAEVKKRTRELAEKNEDLNVAIHRLQEASLTDSLTGLHNRRFLISEIDKEIALVERYYGDPSAAGSPDPSIPRPDFVLLMVDLDGFKPINDTHGHAAGDSVLLQVKDVLERACRRSDTILRWGGDEFLVIGRFANPAVAETLAERIRTLVAEHVFDLGEGTAVRLSCSIGFAFYPFVTTAPRRVSWEQVVTIADRALYVAKASGKNAWVGIFGTKKTPSENVASLINTRLEILALDGSVELHTSLTEPGRLVFGRT
ncbi:MAG TPA: two-component regulator propeller domain-containing protein [Thermoanaerobaculia bacterium]|nr:two-component regulator propeller domain-containing protein [Thermoanaerobaculia bacterium]HQR66032.1 two-component regulator propeller domain-containing protein [Thermoanaerobaculia bacterium]